MTESPHYRRNGTRVSRLLRGLVVVGLAGRAEVAHAEPPASLDARDAGTAASTAIDVTLSNQGPAPAEETPVMRQARGRGFVFHPSRPPLHAFRLGLGAYYDAIDPQVMYGYVVRVPQITADVRYGLGAGWSLRGHLNSMFVTTEALLGGSYAWRAARWSFEAALSAGIYVGTLHNFAFDVLLLAPQYRPELTVGYDFGEIALSLRGSVLLMGPERVDVGGVWGSLDTSSPFAGHSETLYVENTTRGNAVWYFGVGALTTRAYYQIWILFPDSPALYTYPRIVAGYEF
jgi:hypothetical protein